MSPKLLVAIKTAFTPKKWFKERPELTCEATEVEERQHPVPGIYKHVRGRGWFLAATISYNGEEKSFEPCSPPKHVIYSKILHRYFFDDDYQLRKAYGRFLEGSSKRDVGFFRVDDVAWVNCWDPEGNFIPGPYKRYVPDVRTRKFRPMTRMDDPNYLKQKKARLSQGSGGQSQRPSLSVGEGKPPAFDRSLTDGSCSTANTAFTNELWEYGAATSKSAANGAPPSLSSVHSSRSNRPSEDSGYHTKSSPCI